LGCFVSSYAESHVAVPALPTESDWTNRTRAGTATTAPWPDCVMPNSGCSMPGMGISQLKRRTTRDGKSSSPGRARTSLADALFTGTQQKVLRLIYGQPHRSFFANELIELTGSGSGAVQRELARLVESGLVTSRQIGRQRHYQANPSAPIYAELHSIVTKTVGAADPIRRALEPLQDRISVARIFGSVAKGEDSAASDIDVLVVGDNLMLEDLYSALQPVEQRLARKVNPTLLTSSEFARRRKTAGSFVSKVLAGPTIQILGDPDVDRAAR
jgi:predicted nucleotidyltransferase